MKSIRPFLLLLWTTSVFAAATPYDVALLVHEQDASILSSSLTAALAAPEPLVRATAARVVAVRDLTALVPQVRTQLETESDPMAARELIRTIGLLGTADDLGAAVKSALRFPAGIDDALAVAVARRGAADALANYFTTLAQTRMGNHSEFFRTALWGEGQAVALAGSRLVGANDEKGWRGLLQTVTDSDIAMSPGVLASSLDSAEEGMRAATIWYLVRGFAVEPSALNSLVTEKLAVKREELSSNREDFGRELLRRMLGGERVNDPRWLKFLASDEADALLRGEVAALQFLTDEEYAVRYNRCEVQSAACAMPPKRSGIKIPSIPLRPPAFTLPSLLPAGLGDAILDGTRCKDTWIGVGNAGVDRAGRIETLDLKRIGTTGGCKRALETLLRLSQADNTSIRSAFSGPVLLVHAARTPVCLDESAPQAMSASLHRVGGNVQPPRVKKRAEPFFPPTVRKTMSGRNVNIIIESVISTTGCVRSLTLIEQSPYAELNGAALLALSQWTFDPGLMDGKPVDVIFNLTTNFSVGR